MMSSAGRATKIHTVVLFNVFQANLKILNDERFNNIYTVSKCKVMRAAPFYTFRKYVRALFYLHLLF